MDLGRYVARRCLQAVPTILGVVVLVFLLVHLIPGNPAQTLLGPRATPQRIAALNHQLGVDGSLPEQFVRFVGRLFRGDLGISTVTRDDVRRLVWQRAQPTLLLVVFSGALSLLLAVPLALLAATRRNGLRDQIVRLVPLVGLGMPSFWIGIVLTLLFGIELAILPVGDYGDTFGEHLQALVLPSLTVALGIAPLLIRSLRAAMLDVLESDHVTTARAKGISEPRVFRDHVLRPAFGSTVTILGLNLAYLVGGTLVVEKVFALPGIGSLTVDSIFKRDFPVVQGATLVFALGVVAINLITDVVHSAVDPRVRLR